MRVGAVALLAVLMSACAVQSPVPEDHYYRLAPRGAPAAGPTLLPGVLVVARPVAEGVYGERAMLYSDDPGRRMLKQYHYHYWLKAPPRLVQDFLVDELRRLGAAERVVDPDAGFEQAYRLDSRLIRFERLHQPGAVAVELEVTVTAPGEFEPRLIRRYSETRPVAEEEVTVAVAGFEAALGAIAQGLRADLARLAEGAAGAGH